MKTNARRQKSGSKWGWPTTSVPDHCARDTDYAYVAERQKLARKGAWSGLRRQSETTKSEQDGYTAPRQVTAHVTTEPD